VKHGLETSLFGDPVVDDIAGWCRRLIDGLKDGGVWGIPRTGVVFRKTGPDRMMWVGNMPAVEKDGESNRVNEFRSTRDQFGKAGIEIDREEKMMEFDDIDAAKNFYNVMDSLPEIRRDIYSSPSLSQSRTNPGLDFRPKPMTDVAKSMISPVSVTESLRREAAPHRFGPGYDNVPNAYTRRSHNDHSIAKMLLRTTNKPVDVSPNAFKNHAGPLAPPLEIDDRPLIDRLHEAMFGNPIGLQWIKEKYDFRTILRKAHCFTLDRDTSRLTADFSVAIASDLESARQMAIPPFPVTWIDLDNQARIDRVKELGIPLTKTAEGGLLGPVVPRVGWLIWPAVDLGGFYAAYCCEVEQTLMMAPLCYWWHTGKPNPDPEDDADTKHDFMRWMTFGVRDCNVNPVDAYPSVTPMHIDVLKQDAMRDDVRGLMTEIAGEMRHIWGFLIALGAGQLGLEAKTSPQAKPLTERRMPNGKPLLPLEHKVLHLHLAKKATPVKIVARMTTHHKNREHEVRAHFRKLKNKDGTVRARVPVKSHKRGDERLGKIEKTYKVER
jgi:hypothetical protein